GLEAWRHAIPPALLVIANPDATVGMWRSACPAGGGPTTATLASSLGRLTESPVPVGALLLGHDASCQYGSI
ncbi:MAG: hypothetical protein KAU50_05525, partial [Candidatus Marinimicrobia bacterium]|nr:hypothetical protein [Candidatus Neomarinimicrobiota bacterium]